MNEVNSSMVVGMQRLNQLLALYFSEKLQKMNYLFTLPERYLKFDIETYFLM